jgi:hypothetical protein
MWGSRYIVIVIGIAHRPNFRALVTAIIAPGLVPLSAIFIAVSPMATGARVFIIIAAAAALGPASGIVISAATAASGCPRTVVGTAATYGSVRHSVHCMMLARFAFGVSAVYPHGIHSSSPFII